VSLQAAAIGRLLLLGPEDVDGSADVGGKARGLLAIREAGLETAPWFVLRASAQPSSGRMTPALARELARGIGSLDPSGAGTFAVRSSALDEDVAGRSFAGQYETSLDVPASEVPEAVERCWRSADAEGVRAYREAVRLAPEPRGMAVVVQSMVGAAFSGIAFSAAPDGGRDAVVVAVPGLGAALAAGRQDGEEFRVAEDGHGVSRVRRAGLDGPGLDVADVGRIAAAARHLESRLGSPQDIEWCLTGDGQLLLVQARPITAMPDVLAGPSGSVRLWDNANIVESFPGLTLPLTFSIAREAYAKVYRGACRALGVGDPAIRAEADAFDGLLGHIRGRVYYDVGSWHRILALLPAFRSNQALLERMMGAARPGSGGERAAPVAGGWVPIPSAITIAWRMLAVLIAFERRARRFIAFQRGTLRAARRRNLDSMEPAELVGHLDELTERVLGSWQLPIFNDLAVMLFHGSLRRAAERWCDPSADAVINRLLRSGTHPGVEAASSLREIARAIRAEPAWLAALDTLAAPAAGAGSRLATDPELDGLRRLLTPYLSGWGGRPPGALHLDRPTLADDPRLLLVTLRDLAAVEEDRTPADHRPPGPDDRDPRLVVRGSPPVRAVRSTILSFLLRRARLHLAWRERMRLLRMDVFAMGRAIVSALDRAWIAAGVLDAPGEVHYLEIGEIRDAVRQPGRSDGLALLAGARRKAYEALRVEPPPPDRFESNGSVPPPRAATGGSTNGQRANTKPRLVGVGVSPGRAQGEAVVVREPRDTPGVAGRIVVAPSTDPGWLPLMLAARGLVVEHGSLLSHSAIVAREIGLPAVVGVAGATAALAARQLVQIDGAAGEVEILERAAGDGDG
jgi:rifampicin phosphotransferase